MKKEQSRAAALEALLEEERKSHKVFFVFISWRTGREEEPQGLFVSISWRSGRVEEPQGLFYFDKLDRRAVAGFTVVLFIFLTLVLACYDTLANTNIKTVKTCQVFRAIN